MTVEPIEIRVLRREDDRTQFRSGDDALDLYFHRYAGQNQFRYHIGVTYVATQAKRIIGFVTVSPGSMDAETAAGKAMPPYPLPILRVARLAVAGSSQGRGIGQALLRYCIELAEKLMEEVGCVGLMVDAKPGAEDFYTRFGFVTVEIVEGRQAYRPSPTTMFLPLGSVPRPKQ